MLEIFLVIYLCRRIKNIVTPKGYRAGRWQFFTVLTWISCELAGVFVSFLLGKDLLVVMLSGLLCATAGYLLLQRRAQALPDRSASQESWLDNMGQEESKKY